jgi:hypothetical protein
MCAPQALGGRRPHRARLACVAPLVLPVEEETDGERRFRSRGWAPKTPRRDVLARDLSLSSSTLSCPSSNPRPNPGVSNQHRTPFPVVCSRRRHLCRIQLPALNLRRKYAHLPTVLRHAARHREWTGRISPCYIESDPSPTRQICAQLRAEIARVYRAEIRRPQEGSWCVRAEIVFPFEETYEWPAATDYSHM